MAQWSKTDAATNAVSWVASSLNQGSGATAQAANNTAMFGNTTSDAFISGMKVGVFGVSTAETTGSGSIANSVIVDTAGSGFSVLPTVVFTASPAGVNAAATATALVATVAANNTGSSGSYVPGDVLTIDNTGGTATVNATATVTTTAIRTATTIVAAGSGYANGDTITLATGTATTPAVLTVTTGAANTGVASLAITNAGVFTTNPTLSGGATANVTGSGTGATVTVTMKIANVAVSNSGVYTALPTQLNANAPTGGTGSGATLKLTFGVNSVAVSNVGTGYTTVPSVSFTGTGGTGATAHVSGLQESHGIAHAGWVLRKEGTGGRAGRVQYETLVASSSISSDASDDQNLPE